jgi:hypothetical protein
MTYRSKSLGFKKRASTSCRVLCVAAFGSLAALPAAADTAATTTAIQNALNNCGSASCVIQLACGPGTTESPTIPNTAYAAVVGVNLQNKHGVVIQGCGMDSTVVSWNVAPPTQLTSIDMFDLPGASGITFRDMTISLNMNCNGSGGDCGMALGAIVNVRDGAEGVRIERVHFKTTRQGTNNVGIGRAFPAGVNADITMGDSTAVPPESVYVSSSQFETSGTGVRFMKCNDCWVEGSTFQDAPAAAGYTSVFAMVFKSEGAGVRITNSTFDMHPNNTPAPNDLFGGLILWNVPSYFTGDPPRAGEGAQIIGNTFKNIQSEPTLNPFRPLVLYGYNGAIISDNQFRCEGSLCNAWAITTEGSGSLNQDGTTGPPCNNYACNRRNLFANNVFDRFQTSTGFCPILLQIKDNTQAGNGGNNLAIGNVFRTDSASNGICGDATGNDSFQYSNDLN